MYKDSIRHLFPGSNTYAGFCGYFEGLVQRSQRCVILKGGPGVGKSTLMADAGRHFEGLNQPVTYYHCSGDPDSLDAVWAEEAGFLMLDGTAPHVVDPMIPGARDSIVNLGICLKEGELSAHRQEIGDIGEEMGACYARAYRYLKAAYMMRQDAAAVYDAAFSEKDRREMEKELIALLPDGPEGQLSHAFAGAITCKGVIQQVDSILTGQVYCLDLPWGFDGNALFSSLMARTGHLSGTVYHDPLDGAACCHAEWGGAVFTTAVMMDARVFTPSFNGNILRREGQRLSFDRAVYDLNLNQAVEALAAAKALHDRLERYYIDAMDYSRLSAVKQEVMEELPR